MKLAFLNDREQAFGADTMQRQGQVTARVMHIDNSSDIIDCDRSQIAPVFDALDARRCPCRIKRERSLPVEGQSIRQLHGERAGSNGRLAMTAQFTWRAPIGLFESVVKAPDASETGRD